MVTRVWTARTTDAEKATALINECGFFLVWGGPDNPDAIFQPGEHCEIYSDEQAINILIVRRATPEDKAAYAIASERLGLNYPPMEVEQYVAMVD